MNILTAYYILLAPIIRLGVIILTCVCVFCCFRPPQYVDAAFPAPKGYKETGKRIITVKKYPSFQDTLLLWVVFCLDSIILRPLKAPQDGWPIWVMPFAMLLLLSQSLAAMAWCCIRGDWLAAERNMGLWGSKWWSAYYMTFVSVSLACMGPMVFVGSWRFLELVIYLAPHILSAFFHAYKPLVPEVQWTTFVNSTQNPVA
jgi:hypothetical protein